MGRVAAVAYLSAPFAGHVPRPCGGNLRPVREHMTGEVSHRGRGPSIAVSIIGYLPCLACFAAAGALAWHQIEGWGWFLFVGVLVGVKVSCDGGEGE